MSNEYLTEEELQEAMRLARENAQRAASGCPDHASIPIRDECRIYYLTPREFQALEEKEKSARILLRQMIETWEKKDFKLWQNKIQEVKSFLSGL